MNEAGEPQPVSFRLMRMEDVEQVFAIDQASFSLPWSERSFRFEVTNPNSRAWVAETVGADGCKQIVGMLVMWVVLDEGHVATLAVHHDHRRQGTAQRLLATALLDGYRLGVRLALLEVRRGNLSAQALYEKFGFRVVGSRPHYYQDNQEDALLMTLHDLDPRALHEFL